MEALKDVSITFDDEGNIRVFEHDRFESTRELRDECEGFASMVGDFTENVQSFMQVLEEQARIIEKEKLRAIGQRNMVDSEADIRKQKKKQQILQIREREAELARLEAQIQSQEKVESKQLAFIDKLINKDT